MSASLDDYLQATMLRSWSWGELDCLLFIADWVRLQTGIDPGAPWRGRYADQRSARRLIKDAGGIEPMVDGGLRCAGLVVRARPCRGDVGLVRVVLRQVGRRVIVVPVGAIALRPNLWAIKSATERHLVARSYPLIKAWGLPSDG